MRTPPGWPGAQQSGGQPPIGQAPYGQAPYGQGSQGQPPFGGPPGGYGAPPSYGQGPRKKSWPLFVGLGLALLMVIGVGITGWLYFTGRFGIGPLSAADKDAVTAIAGGIEAPEWADDKQVECAADELVHESRSDELKQRGLIERDGDDWKYTGNWQSADATSYFEKLLDCDDNWADSVAKTWNIDDADCLENIGTETVGAYFANDLLTLSDKDEDKSVEKASTKAVKDLDTCYVKSPEVPKATAKAAYRGVSFTFTDINATTSGPGKVVIQTGGEGSWTALSGPSVEIPTQEGGRRGCVEAQALATYPWGTKAQAQQKFCGTSKAKRIWWVRSKTCTLSPGCASWELFYEGFRDRASLTAYYTSNGGPCLAVSGSCSDTVLAKAGGRGRLVTWRFPASYNGKFVARIGSLKVKIPR